MKAQKAETKRQKKNEEEAHCECHLCNAIEEHLLGAKEEEARVQVGIVDPIRVNVSAQKQSCTHNASESCLQCSKQCIAA